jgi:hypothetical protein
MAMDAGKLKSDIEKAVLAGLEAAFSKVGGKDNSSAKPDWEKVAKAVSEAAGPIVDTVSQAQILPGIPVTGAAAGATTAPGSIK